MENTTPEEAKKKLYANLEENVPELLTGVGVLSKDGIHQLKIYLTREPTMDELLKIPKEFEGYEVVTQITGRATATGDN